MSTSATDAVKVVNSLLEFSGDDQQALLEVLTDYFTSPEDATDSESNPESNEDETCHEDDDGQANMQGTATMHAKNYDINIIKFQLLNSAELASELGGADGGYNCGDADESGEEAGPMDTDMRISEAMQCVRNNADDIITTSLPTDTLEHELVTQFMTSGCGCKKARGTQCYQQFSQEYVTFMRQSCAELTHFELDMAILGQIAASVNTSATVSTIKAHHKEADRERGYSSFTHQGKPVCHKMFRFLHGIGVKRFKNLARNFKENGLTPRIHGNTRKVPHNALSFSSIQFFVKFVFNYAEQHALLLPGRVPGYSRSDLQLLPSSVSKQAIWRVYHAAAEANGSIHPIAYTTFCFLWRKLTPSVIVMKPRSDLCWQCQQNSTAIVRAANHPEADKSAAYTNALEHLQIVRMERKHYKSICNECKESVRAHFTTADTFTPPPPCSNTSNNSKDIKVHYSFDYAQQVHYPSDPLQPGPIYFLTPRKCTVFGVACEALPRQINFLTDEAGDCGKGANAVVSRIHYFFDHHGFGEKDVYLHADNCTGQNKNSCMMQHLAWRTLTNRHTNVRGVRLSEYVVSRFCRLLLRKYHN